MYHALCWAMKEMKTKQKPKPKHPEHNIGYSIIYIFFITKTIMVQIVTPGIMV